MDRYYSKSAVTLMELMVAIALLGLLVVGISSLNTYAQYHLITSSRRAEVQNELSLVLEQMSRDIVRAMGDSTNNPNHAGIEDLGNGFRVRIDVNNTPWNYGDDNWIAYTLSGNVIRRDEGGGPIDLNTRGVITDFARVLLPDAVNPTGIQVTLTGRYNPTQGQSSDNPQLTMQTTVYSRSASIN